MQTHTHTEMRKEKSERKRETEGERASRSQRGEGPQPPGAAGGSGSPRRYKPPTPQEITDGLREDETRSECNLKNLKRNKSGNLEEAGNSRRVVRDRWYETVTRRSLQKE